MSRIENPEVKKFLIEYVSSRLDSDCVFSETFGKGYARKRLTKWLKTVYTNEMSRAYNGECGEDSITIFAGEENGPALSVSDIENSEQLSCTAGHEGVHLALSRTIGECEKYKIANGTGIFEYYANRTEMGRGLNEGLTNWIWGRVGIRPKSYPVLTKSIDLLELAVRRKKCNGTRKRRYKRKYSKTIKNKRARVFAYSNYYR